MHFRLVSYILFTALCLELTGVCRCQSVFEKGHAPISGHVTASDGTPLPGVIVSSQLEHVTTDKSGSFRIEHPGLVLHVQTGATFQPRSIVVTPEMSTLEITLEPARSSLLLAACAEQRSGFERVGWGKYGLQFDVPRHIITLVRGKVDVDYVVDIIKVRKGRERLELWFGPYAMSSTPDDPQFVQSLTFTTRNVIMPAGLVRGSNGGVIGMDTSGHLPDRRVWRQMAIVGSGALYQNVSPEVTAIFDPIIDSACWNPDTNEVVR